MQPETPPIRDTYYPRFPTEEEWMRWAWESRKPGDVISWLVKTGEIRHYREVAALIGVPQEREWHPEGPVDVHTCHVLDAAAEIAEREQLQGDDRAVLLFAALTHDFGKPRTTVQRVKRGRKRWTSYDHDRVGAPMAADFLRRLGISPDIVARVEPLVECHMDYRAFAQTASPEKTLERLEDRLRPATVRDLALLVEADHSGRPPLPKGLPAAAHQMLKIARTVRRRRSGRQEEAGVSNGNL